MYPYIGPIQLFPYNFEPRGWILCDRRSLQVMQNQALFSLIGTTFGGNGTTTFKIPDLRNANPLAMLDQMRCYIAAQGLYPQRS